MTLTVRRARGLSPPSTLTVVVIAAAAGVAALTTIVVAAGNDDLYQRTLRVWLLNYVALPYIVAGLVAWRRRPDSQFGPLMIATGFVDYLSVLQWAHNPVVTTVGQLFDLVVGALWLHVFLAYPTGRLTGRAERLIVGSAYVAAVGMQVLILALGGFGAPNVLQVTSRPALAEVLQDLQLLSLAALSLAGAAVLLVRRRRSGPVRRRPVVVLVDTFGLSLVMAALLLAAGAFDLPGFEVLRVLTFTVVGLAPIAFVAGLLDSRLARGNVATLVVRLQDGTNPPLQPLLADALRDPTLEVAYWLPKYAAWADEDGAAVELPAGDPRRAVSVLGPADEPLAALIYDDALRDDPDLVAGVAAAARIALENGRLQAELRARLHELQGSRARVVEATQRERQRLERDLHDGAQARLVALALELGMIGNRAEQDADTRRRVLLARDEVSQSLQELRAVAHGLHPAVVSGHGLTVALESLAAAGPVPTTVHSDVARLPEAVEITAYYLVSECLANIGKHAHASAATVTATTDGRVLVVDVADDGIGGADMARGSGLRGIADRVESLGGRLWVSTQVAGGTRVRAELPCE